MSPVGAGRWLRPLASATGAVGLSRAVGARAAAVLATIAVVGGLLVTVWVGPVGAHTDLIQGSPGPGQRIGGEVDFVDLIFAAPVKEVEIDVFRPDGSRQPGEMVVTDGQLIRSEFEALTEPGRYLVEYRMISDDGDFTVQTYFFDYDETAVAPRPLGQIDLPDDPFLTVRTGVGAGAVAALTLVCGFLLLRLRRSRAELAARRAERSV